MEKSFPRAKMLANSFIRFERNLLIKIGFLFYFFGPILFDSSHLNIIISMNKLNSIKFKVNVFSGNKYSTLYLSLPLSLCLSFALSFSPSPSLLLQNKCPTIPIAFKLLFIAKL